jgi:hypothetical protein
MYTPRPKYLVRDGASKGPSEPSSIGVEHLSLGDVSSYLGRIAYIGTISL